MKKINAFSFTWYFLSIEIRKKKTDLKRIHAVQLVVTYEESFSFFWWGEWVTKKLPRTKDPLVHRRTILLQFNMNLNISCDLLDRLYYVCYYIRSIKYKRKQRETSKMTMH